MRFICASILDANASICARARTSEEAPEAGTGTGLGGTGGSTGRVAPGGRRAESAPGRRFARGSGSSSARSPPTPPPSARRARDARGARGIRGEFFGRDIPLRPRGVERDGERALVASLAPASARQTPAAPRCRYANHHRSDLGPRARRFAPPSDPLARPIRRRTRVVRRDEHVRRARVRRPDSALASKGDAKPHPSALLPIAVAVQHLHHDHHEFVLRDVFEDDVGGERDGRFDGRFQARFRARARVDDPRVGLRRPTKRRPLCAEKRRETRRDAATARAAAAGSARNARTSEEVAVSFAVSFAVSLRSRWSQTRRRRRRRTKGGRDARPHAISVGARRERCDEAGHGGPSDVSVRARRNVTPR